jgi:chlorite dismutase
LEIQEASPNESRASPGEASWALRGVRSYLRYVERSEKARLDELSPSLGRPEATRAALIPIRKSTGWWDLPQDERRAILETRSHHISGSMKYMPAVARRLYHGRDLGEPFDFLTWFEYAPGDADLFEDLVAMLRATEEWTFVEREVDIRLARE